MEVQDRRQRTMLSDHLSAAAIKLPASSSSPNLGDLLKFRQEEDLQHQSRECRRQGRESAAAIEPAAPSSASKLTASSSSPNLGDLLKVRQEEDLQECRRRSAASITLGTFLAYEKQDLPRSSLAAVTAAVIRSRTLLDIIRDEEDSRRGGIGAYDGVLTEGGANGGDKNNWRRRAFFKERLRIRRLGNHVDGLLAAGPTLPPPAAASPPRPPPRAGGDATPPTQPQLPTQVAAAAAAAGLSNGDQADGTSGGGGLPATAATVEAQQQQQVRVSLMALLEQTDRSGFAVSSLLESVGQEENDGEEEGKSDDAKCCVCMVRRKGAAFIPCGHTFCRLCSRELWVSRGSCPLCNGFILEVLDIF